MDSACWCTDLTAHHLPPSGGRCKEQGEVPFFYLPQAKMLLFRYLHMKGEVGEVENGFDNPLCETVSELTPSS